MEVERALGFEPTDREFEKLGLRHREPRARHRQAALHRGQGPGHRRGHGHGHARTRSCTSLNKPDDFILAMVEFLDGDSHRVHYLRQPFQRRAGLRRDERELSALPNCSPEPEEPRMTTTRRSSSKSPCRSRPSTRHRRGRSRIRHGHPTTLHLWWARRPLAAARAVIFAQMVDDPSAHPDLFPTEKTQEKERQRLFRIIEELVQWENTTNETVLQAARDEIWQSWRRTCAENADHPRAKELFDRDKLPAFHDPFAGGGALPLEAQRLGLEAYASDLNPVAVLINKAMIEIPPKFAGQPPVNPESREDAELVDAGVDGARRAWPRTCATTASGCATRPRSASATSTRRSRSRPRWRRSGRT